MNTSSARQWVILLGGLAIFALVIFWLFSGDGIPRVEPPTPRTPPTAPITRVVLPPTPTLTATFLPTITPPPSVTPTHTEPPIQPPTVLHPLPIPDTLTPTPEVSESVIHLTPATPAPLPQTGMDTGRLLLPLILFVVAGLLLLVGGVVLLYETEPSSIE